MLDYELLRLDCSTILQPFTKAKLEKTGTIKDVNKQSSTNMIAEIIKEK